MPEDPILYYTQPSVMTDPRQHAPLFKDLPRDIPSLCRVVQGLLIHVFWADRYGVKLSQERQEELNLHSVARKIDRILELDNRPLAEPRLKENKLVGNCRDFSVMLTAMLRFQGTPARARCGFGTYFMPGTYEDHWVVEYWHTGDKRWVMVDAQLDAFQQRELRIKFNTVDMPPNKFVPGGLAWQVCRQGDSDPNKFGIFKMRGWWFIRGDLARDFASLNRLEMLPWDCWGLMDSNDSNISAEEQAVWDRVASLTLDNSRFEEMRSLYESDPRLRVPPIVNSYADDKGARPIDLTAL